MVSQSYDTDKPTVVHKELTEYMDSKAERMAILDFKNHADRLQYLTKGKPGKRERYLADCKFVRV